MPRPFPLECGITLQIEYVPAVYARSEAARRFPAPARPTADVEIAKGVFEAREISTPAYLRERAHYDNFVWSIAVRSAFVDMAVLDESVPPIDAGLLARRRARVPKELHGSDKADFIMMCLMKSTHGDTSELERLFGFILENDFTFAEVEQAARDLKSDG